MRQRADRAPAFASDFAVGDVAGGLKCGLGLRACMGVVVLSDVGGRRGGLLVCGWRRLLAVVGVAPLALAVALVVSAAPAWAASSHTAYITNAGSGSATPIDTATNTAGTPIGVGGNPLGVAATPDQGPAAAFSETAAA